ncbi:hypothetical protein NXC24_PA00064 (plasmid) [Rhizobium sp. NXC24]|nr:hypothetical protein NXC24_PA00064 [Rhizobium sp. NXC24]
MIGRQRSPDFRSSDRGDNLGLLRIILLTVQISSSAAEMIAYLQVGVTEVAGVKTGSRFRL